MLESGNGGHEGRMKTTDNHAEIGDAEIGLQQEACRV